MMDLQRLFLFIYLFIIKMHKGRLTTYNEEEWRMRSDLIETFKIVNRKYDINPEFFSAR